jgi:subtilase family serine protease
MLAGIQALVNQSTKTRWGNPNPYYYQIASAEYGTGGSSSCNSNGAAIGSNCAFYDIRLGDIEVNCQGPYNCYNNPPSFFGILSVSSNSLEPAYDTTTGWDFATGIGSVNAWNLIKKWSFSGGSQPNLTASR